MADTSLTLACFTHCFPRLRQLSLVRNLYACCCQPVQNIRVLEPAVKLPQSAVRRRRSREAAAAPHNCHIGSCWRVRVSVSRRSPHAFTLYPLLYLPEFLVSLRATPVIYLYNVSQRYVWPPGTPRRKTASLWTFTGTAHSRRYVLDGLSMRGMRTASADSVHLQAEYPWE